MDGLSKAQRLIMERLPGIPEFASARECLIHCHDPHSVLRGELDRGRRLYEAVKHARIEAELQGASKDEVRLAEQKAFHEFFVGRLLDPRRKHAPMYEGVASNFAVDMLHLTKAFEDVERMYTRIMRYLPPTVHLQGEEINLHERLKRPLEVRVADDPIELLCLFRHPIGSPDDQRRMRGHALRKLVLAQVCFEFRRTEAAPERLQDEAEEIRVFLHRALLKDRPATPMRIVADLDPNDRYRCRSYRLVSRRDIYQLTPTEIEIPVLVDTFTTEDGEEIPLILEERGKEPITKMLVKRTRFRGLIGLGDEVAVRFVVEAEHVNKLVRQVRRQLVCCPAQCAIRAPRSANGTGINSISSTHTRARCTKS